VITIYLQLSVIADKVGPLLIWWR